MLAYLRERVAARPDDAASWRLLGACLLREGEMQAAADALGQAVAVSPHSAAAQYDLGRCLAGLERHAEAAACFRRAQQLAPGSHYAQQSADWLSRMPPAVVQQVGYQVRQFDASDRAQPLADAARRAPDPGRLFYTVEAGAVYNSNVALTPISRDFGAATRESFQGFLNPAVEYRLVNNDFWKAGPSLTSYVNVNENDSLSSLNLQSFQPGMFAERTICRDTTILVPRLQYDYTIDQFDGVTFGRRHAATASLASLWDRGDTTLLYWASNYTDFVDDGATPATSSRDGWGHSLGGSHTWPLAMPLLSSFTLGGDLEWVPAEGTDFAYMGGTMYAGTEIPLGERTWCQLEGGWGLRDYYESTLSPSRNETLIRGSARLTRQLTPRWSLSGVFSYNRFASENDLFDAERYTAGLVATLRN